MKNPTIWESAGRPLFVRTVWLEGSELRRGLQRHFLWDYDTRRPLQRLNSINNTLQLQETADLDFDDFNVHEDDVLLVGSAKVKLHEPYKLASNKKSNFPKYRRRSSIFNQRCTSYDSYHLDSSKDISRRTSDISEIPAIKNSLTQIHKSTDTAEELLADRVLHWLGLAGKEDFLKNLNELNEMEVKLSKTCKLRQDAIKRYHNKIQNIQKSKPSKTKNIQSAATTATQSSTPKNTKTSDPVKHITIIFNKEGQPIRLNRPAKNIDLCALSSSPGTTRKLAGTLASARLYKSAENNSKANYIRAQNGNVSSKAISARRRLETVADLTNSTLQKRLHENSGAGGHKSLLDSKKQLHIFMPTLPKKALSSSVYGTEDGVSELSHNFSEMCKIYK